MGAVSGMLANSACGLSGKLGASGSAFAGKGAFIPDIKVLRDEMEDDEAEHKQPAAGAAPDSSSSGKRPAETTPEKPEQPTKKVRWFDVAAASRSESQANRRVVGVARAHVFARAGACVCAGACSCACACACGCACVSCVRVTRVLVTVRDKEMVI